MADLDLHAHGAGELRNADPIDAVGAQCARGKLGISAYRDAVTCRINIEHVQRSRRRDLQALALADGESRDAVVMADDVAIARDEFAGGVGHFSSLLFEVGSQKLLIVAAGYEADLL